MYNHFDSYPDGLGANVIEFIKSTSIDEMKAIAKRLVLVKDDDVCPKALRSQYKKTLNTGVGGSGGDKWYNYLRGAQGELSFYKDKKFKHMIDYASFLESSLFCEYAYIINLDTNKLEFYVGFNHNPKAAGRYANAETHGVETKYYGVVLAQEFALQTVASTPANKILKRMEEAEGKLQKD